MINRRNFLIAFAICLCLVNAHVARAIEREVLGSPRIYYIRSDGNDANNGLSDSATGAFRTFQKAVDTAKMLDFNRYNVTIQAGNEPGTITFTENVLVQYLSGGGQLVFEGNGSGRTILTSSTGDTFTISIAGMNPVYFGGMTLKSAGNAIKVAYGSLAIIKDDVNFGNCAENAIWVHDSQALLQILNSQISISGNMKNFLFIQYGMVFVEANTINLVGNPQFGEAFVSMYPRGAAQFVGNTLSGSAIGKRYSIYGNSTLNLNGVSALTALPGSLAGTFDPTSIVIAP